MSSNYLSVFLQFLVILFLLVPLLLLYGVFYGVARLLGSPILWILDWLFGTPPIPRGDT